MIRLGSMPRTKVPSLKAFANSLDPFEDESLLLNRLLMEKEENRHLEFKVMLPIGKQADKKLKYRTVKAAISFANTDGGFILVGVDSNGVWQGVPEEQLSQLDAAHFSELFDNSVSPEFNFKYRIARYENSSFLILHVPPSPHMPHVTTENKTFKHKSGQSQVILEKYALYYRSGSKSEKATPAQFQRIVEYRVELVRKELLRRVEEVPVYIPTPVKAGLPNSTAIDTTLRTTNDPLAPAFRRTTNPDEADALLVHEQLPEGYTDDVNNALDINNQLAGGPKSFNLGRDHYYKIYAQREQVSDIPGRVEMLGRSGMIHIYAPFLYWFSKMSNKEIALVIRSMCAEMRKQSKRQENLSLVRLVILLGGNLQSWFRKILDETWQSYPQRPDYFYTFGKMSEKLGETDSRLVAVGKSKQASLEIEGQEYKATELLQNPDNTQKHLSAICSKVTEDEASSKTQLRTLCRTLDFLAYGDVVRERADEIFAELKKLES